jgi:hypothetical protein
MPLAISVYIVISSHISPFGTIGMHRPALHRTSGIRLYGYAGQRARPPSLGSRVHGIDALLGVLVLSLVVIGPQMPWGYLGLVPLITGLMGRCPLYALFGVSTLHHPQPQ